MTSLRVARACLITTSSTCRAAAGAVVVPPLLRDRTIQDSQQSKLMRLMDLLAGSAVGPSYEQA